MDLQALLNQATRCAECGEYRESARAYRQFLDAVIGTQSVVPADLASVVRSVAFNLAQVLNKSGEYAAALESVDLGLGCSPTALGQAIAYAAKGEALCGLGRQAQGDAAFDRSVGAHPIVGRLNSADSMARLGTEAMLRRAEEFVDAVETSFGHQLNPGLRAEVLTVRGKVAAGRGDAAGARALFERVLSEFSDAEAECADARVQLERLPAGGSALPDVLRWVCGCGKKLSAAAHLAGRTGRCPNCGAAHTIPTH